MRPLVSRLLTLNLRSKVILPYLLLTFVVALIGAYVVTNLVAGTMSERLTNQLLEAGRTVSDSLARREVQHLELARMAAFTRGLDEALYKRDRDKVLALVQPVAIGLDAECLIVTDADGQELVHMLKQDDGAFKLVAGQSGASGLWIVQTLLDKGDPNSLPRRTLGLHPLNRRYYYFSAIPVGLGSQVVGVIVVGTSLDSLLPHFKTASLADVIVYLGDGSAIATSFAPQENEATLLKDLSITPPAYDAVLSSDEFVGGENVRLHGRWYRLARGPLRVGDGKLGVFAVALPLDFIIQTGATSRNFYSLLFTVAMACVVLVGYGISKLITRPLSLLVRMSQAVADGDLNQSTGIKSTDEIGVLAATFDGMAERLAERTRELEKAYHVLEQLDKTKANFIEVVAHELRTPLTLIHGYAQLLEAAIHDKPEAAQLLGGVKIGVSRMHEIVNSMLVVTKIDSRVLEVCAQPTPIAPLIQSLRTEFELASQERRLTLTTDGLDDLPPVEADPDLLYKMFYQLVINAIKYTPDGGSVTVSGRLVSEEGGKPAVEVVVSDTGIGIDPVYHELIFEKFYQTGEVMLHSSGRTTFKGGGPGLGLAIAHGIVSAHNGRIWVESEGHDEESCPGSRFYVRLPTRRVSP